MYSPSFNLNYHELWTNPTSDSNPQIHHDLYQPPLSAYSPEYPGSSNLNHHKNQLSPMLQLKLNKLNEIRYYGYKTLRPIGINKTMEEYHQDLQKDEEVNDDNDTVVEPPVEVSEPNTSRNGLVLPAGVDNNDIDLDDDMPNMDSDEFMAQDVEYEDMTFDN